jgi:hypothetical protein
MQRKPRSRRARWVVVPHPCRCGQRVMARGAVRYGHARRAHCLGSDLRGVSRPVISSIMSAAAIREPLLDLDLREARHHAGRVFEVGLPPCPPCSRQLGAHARDAGLGSWNILHPRAPPGIEHGEHFAAPPAAITTSAHRSNSAARFRCVACAQHLGLLGRVVVDVQCQRLNSFDGAAVESECPSMLALETHRAFNEFRLSLAQRGEAQRDPH